MEKFRDMEQRSDEWYAARRGSLGASEIHGAIARTKAGNYYSTRANSKARMVAERLGGMVENFTTGAMQWGIDMEDSARVAYSLHTGQHVAQIAIVPHHSIKGTHASPDGLVGDDGLVEFKCPNTATHIETLITEKVAVEYEWQMQWQMACTGRSYCDFVSFDPRMPEHLQLFIKRYERDNKMIATMEDEVQKFLAEVEADVLTLQNRGE